MTHSPPRLVLFDCDGVLVDSEHTTNLVIRDDLAARGLDLTLAEVMDRFVGGTMSNVMERAAAMGANVPATWLDDIYGKIYGELARSVEIIPGVEAVLDLLDAHGIGYAVGSNGRLEKMDITLGRTGLLERFEGRLYSGQDMPQGKPAPDVYLKAAADAGVPPAECVVIEDSANGAKAGKAAKMRTLGFTRDTAPEKLAPHCNDLFEDMTELPGLLGLA